MSKSAYASPASCLARVTCRAAAAASTWACTELNRWLPSPPPTTAPPLNARRRRDGVRQRQPIGGAALADGGRRGGADCTGPRSRPGLVPGRRLRPVLLAGARHHAEHAFAARIQRQPPTGAAVRRRGQHRARRACPARTGGQRFQDGSGGWLAA
ncbi:hypothetical protein G6F22_019318 [Rhizopus arrhizus]|nr:hypothetical protein G6F22_019318 [Rhizopus arrhizus]